MWVAHIECGLCVTCHPYGVAPYDDFPVGRLSAVLGPLIMVADSNTAVGLGGGLVRADWMPFGWDWYGPWCGCWNCRSLGSEEWVTGAF